MIKQTINLSEIVDKICELEGYIEYLEDKENKSIPSFNRKQDRLNLREARIELDRLYSIINH